MKNILCFGDCNTFGYNPENGGRYDTNTRWTALLQQFLGDDYRVIEEGLNGRTTVIEDNLNQSRNGKDMLYACLNTHKPLDLVIISLGTNDLKKRFNLTAKEVSNGMEQLILLIRSSIADEIYNPSPEILILSPIKIDENVVNLKETSYDLKSSEHSKILPEYYEKIACNHNCHFLHAGNVARASEKDHIHLDPESHRKLAQALNIKIREIFEIEE